MEATYIAEISYVKKGDKQVHSVKLTKRWLPYDAIQDAVRNEMQRLRKFADICSVSYFEKKIRIVTFDLEEDE